MGQASIHLTQNGPDHQLRQPFTGLTRVAVTNSGVSKVRKVNMWGLQTGDTVGSGKDWGAEELIPPGATST